MSGATRGNRRTIIFASRATRDAGWDCHQFAAPSAVYDHGERPLKRILDMLACGLAAAIALMGLAGSATADPPHNVVLFVPDGLRAAMVDEQTAPAMAALRRRGVDFANPHALFPTFTTANASALSTGHYLGDTGDFSNTLYLGFTAANASTVPFLEDDSMLGDVDAHFAGDYLDEPTLLKLARDAGFGTAAIGKLGPVLIWDHTARDGQSTIIIDDATGSPTGVPLSPEIAQALAAAGLPATPPARALPNRAQQDYFVRIATKIVLPRLKARNAPFMLVFWSRDPDGTQHGQTDSIGKLVPGINGPSSLAAIRNADDDLAKLAAGLDALGLAATTDIIVAADHGFSTIAKTSATSQAAQGHYDNIPAGELPPGFVALDLAAALGLPLSDPNRGNAVVQPGQLPKQGSGLLGRDPARPDVVVAANGGSDLIYLPAHDRALALRVVAALLDQDYVSGIFVDDDLGPVPGAMPLGAINLAGRALTPRPDIVVSFRSWAEGCDTPVKCAVEIADAGLRQGQGMHGSFSRADTMNFMAAVGPDFKAGFVDEAPVSNADVGRTVAAILGLRTQDKGELVGRVMREAMPGGAVPRVDAGIERSGPAANGLVTELEFQQIDTTRYFDAAGFVGRTVGLPEN
jgi:arylsulfatase A-like enzyme